MVFPSRAHAVRVCVQLIGLGLLLLQAGCDAPTAAPAAPGNDTIVQPPNPADTAHPNGLLSYVVWRNGPRLYTVRADGTGNRPLLPNRFVTWADWAPDGRHLVAVTRAFPSFQGAALSIVDPDSGTVRDLLFLDQIRLPSWSPDGGKIAFLPVGDGSLAIINADGSGLQTVSDDTASAWNTMDDGPTWSPDGQQLAFQRRVGGRWGILMVARDGSDPRAVTGAGDSYAFQPRWSPDGEWIAYGGEGLSLIRPDGTGRVVIDSRVSRYAWSPDSRRIAVGGEGLSVWSLSQGSWVTILPSVFVRQLEWSPDGRWIAFEGGSPLEVVPVEVGARPRAVITFAAGEYLMQLRWRPDAR